MSYCVEFSETAENDLNDIEEYLSQFYPSTARNFFENVKKKFDLIKDMPLMFPEYEEDSYFRKMNVDDYLFFYHVDESTNQIIIHRIFRASRDINSQINNSL